MKSRTSCFDRTLFKKNMTRFAPAWVIYTVCLLMGMLLMRQDNDAYWFSANVAQLLPVTGVINLGYALLVAQLLFGDLYSSRMCGYIHALPVTRESIFGSAVAAGMLYSLIPTVLAAGLAMLLGTGSLVEQGWQIPLLWLLGCNLHYLFFFGVAAFSALCVGNRFAQAVVYGITNFASVIVYWLADTLYVPMLYGVVTNEEPFMLMSPVVWFGSSEYIDVSREFDAGETVRAWFEISDGWGYLAICAVLGVLLLGGALLLYRRRHLECAGDFMAVRILEPVFLVVYSMIVASMFYFICKEIVGASALAYLFVGLTLGCFTGMMLLERQIRVFGKRHLLRFAALVLGVGATLIVTALDPAGIVKWMPEKDSVASVTLHPYYGYSYSASVRLDTPEEISDALRLHELVLEERNLDIGSYTQTLENGQEIPVNNQRITLMYTLKNGQTRTRSYVVDLLGEAGELVIPHFNTLEAIFHTYDGEHTVEGILAATRAVEVSCSRYEGSQINKTVDLDGYYVSIQDADLIRELLEAIVADAEQGTMSQEWDFRTDTDIFSTYWMNFDMGDNMVSVAVYSDSSHTNTWLTEHGFISQELEEQQELGGITADFETN